MPAQNSATILHPNLYNFPLFSTWIRFVISLNIWKYSLETSDFFFVVFLKHHRFAPFIFGVPQIIQYCLTRLLKLRGRSKIVEMRKLVYVFEENCIYMRKVVFVWGELCDKEESCICLPCHPGAKPWVLRNEKTYTPVAAYEYSTLFFENFK